MESKSSAATRRSHKKSRHGCLQCKKNRTKCDEEKPSCRRCVRTGQDCSLRQPNADLLIIPQKLPDTPQSIVSTQGETPQIDATAKAGIVSPGPINQSQAPGPSSLTDSERDRLRLMYHYTHSTSKTLAALTLNTEEGLAIWCESAPLLAFKHDFMLHGLLCVASLHLALSDSSDSFVNEHTALAIHHYDAGIAGFRSYLDDVTEENASALFAFGCLLAVYSFGINRTSLSQLNPLAKIHEILIVLRGPGTIVKRGLHWIKQGPWAPTLWSGQFDEAGTLPEDIEATLAGLIERIDSTITTSTQSHLYKAAIETVRQSFLLAINRPFSQMTFVLFAILTQPEFLTMVCIGEPLSLAIIAHYAIILHWARQHIWFQGWGKETVDAVRDTLPREWQPCIAWAVQEVYKST